MWILFFSLLVLSFLVQLLFLCWIYLRPIFINKKINVESFSSFQPPVSIVICAKNEEENLSNFLPKVLNQKYPNFEVIVVDDSSEDNTVSVLKELALSHPHLSFVSIEKEPLHNIGKKYPLTIGIKKAKHEILLLTDADCYPVSENWITNIVSQYSNEKTDIVLSYGGYQKEKSLLNYIIRFETLIIAIQYFSMATIGLTYMGVGRNLSYKKNLFFKHKGFKKYLHLSSGDDDLMIKKMATKNNVSIVFKEESHTRSLAKNTFWDWTIQKNRHISTSEYVSNKVKFLNYLYPLSLIAFLVLSACLFTNDEIGYGILGAVFLRYILFYILSFQWSKNLSEKDLFVFSPIMELLLIPIYLYFATFSFFTKKIQWK
jgi:glycosyltransferase involved in cell wall biosynthesis